MVDVSSASGVRLPQTEQDLLPVLRATLESTADGIWVVDPEPAVPIFNQKFLQMWSVPEALTHPDQDDERLHFIAAQTRDPEGFIAKIRQLFRDRSSETTLELLELKDDRVFEWYSQPLYQGDRISGRVCSFRDISVCKHIERQLRFAQYALQNISDQVVCWTQTGQIRYVNQSVCQLLGYTAAEMYQLTIHDLNPNYPPEVWAAHWQDLKQQGSLAFETTVRSRQGKLIPLEVKATYLEFDGVGYNFSVAHDIRDRRQAEEALRLIVEGTAAKTGEEFLHSCVRYLVEVLQVRYALLTEIVNEAQTRVRILAFWEAGASNSEAQTNLEYDLPGTPCGTLYHGETCHYSANLQTLFPEDEHLVELSAESYLGMLVTDSFGHTLGHLAVLDVKPMQPDPGRELILKIFASRAGAELERKQAEEKFVKAFRASPSPIAITTLQENRFVDVNSSFLKMSGYSLEQLIHHTPAELNLGVPRETYTKIIQQALETGSLHNQEVEFRTKTGELRTVLLSIELIDLAGAQCVLNLVNDITERKRLENELISLVSHELRTPMTSLLGALDLLGSGQLGTLTPQGQQVLTIATNNTERLTRLVNDILDLEQMKSGKVAMQKVNCNIASLITQAVETMQPMATKNHLTIITESISAELLADPDRILQTLTNLLSNAIKFSPPNSIIWLRALQRDGTIELQVEDQGRGIPADKLQVIFDRFQQVDASDSRKKGGTGLGLAICRKIVEQHDGKIWVESTLGRGSIFHIQLPLLLAQVV